MLRGGADAAKAAGIVIAGGHTVKDKEIKYGLSVVGMIDPKRIIENSGAHDGDVLILTKALGTGILSTALKAGDLGDDHYDGLIRTMTQLNREASEVMMKRDVHACTDITGNALFGHAIEMARASGVTMEMFASQIPILPGTMAAIDKHYLTGGAATNRRYADGFVRWDRDVDEALEHVFYDPQTSGGLLISVAQTEGQSLLDDIKAVCPDASIVGNVEKGDAGLRIV